MEQPKVTVIVPCYNHEKFVASTVESVVNQTYKNIELIVINDGSTDNSFEVLTNLRKRYEFKLIDQPNKGLMKTLNESLQNLPLGKYVCLLASDDYWPLDKIEIQVAYMERNPDCYLCFGGHTEVDQNSAALQYIQYFPPRTNVLNELLLTNYISAPTVMLRESVFSHVGYYDLNYRLEDWYMWLKVASKFPHLGFLDRNLAYYRIHSDNYHKNNLAVKSESLKILNDYSLLPVYQKAVSIVQLKYIVKSFLISCRSGMHALKEEFHFSVLINLLRCFINQEGPFRKKKKYIRIFDKN